jgi:mannose-6-phosphate isomerase-like protein (cupin superfamily)
VFVWHHHNVEDELFLVGKGTLGLRFRDRQAITREGERTIVPYGAERLPVANEEVHVILPELKSSLNAGYIDNEKTVHSLERI